MEKTKELKQVKRHHDTQFTALTSLLAVVLILEAHSAIKWGCQKKVDEWDRFEALTLYVEKRDLGYEFLGPYVNRTEICTELAFHIASSIKSWMTQVTL